MLGTVPDLRGMTKLRTLNLANNFLNGSLSTVMQLPAIMIVSMYTNPLNTELPSELPNSLSEIYLFGCGLYGTIPPSWASSNLKRINLHMNELTGSVPCFGPKMKELFLHENEFSG